MRKIAAVILFILIFCFPYECLSDCQDEIKVIALSGEKNSLGVWGKVFSNEQTEIAFYYAEVDSSVAIFITEKDSGILGIGLRQKGCQIFDGMNFYTASDENCMKMVDEIIDLAKSLFPELSGEKT